MFHFNHGRDRSSQIGIPATGLACALFAFTCACASGPTTPRPKDAFVSLAPRSDEKTLAEEPTSTPITTPGNLEELLELALIANPRVRAAQAEFEAGLQIAKQVSSLPDPELTANYYLEEVETRVGPQKWSLGVRQRFPNSEKLDAARNVAEFRSHAARAQLAAVMQSVVLEVKLAWFELFYLEQAILSVKEDRDRLQSLEEVIRRDYATGSIAYTSLIRAQVELGQSENQLVSFTDQRTPAIARVNVALHRPIDSPVTSPTDLPVPEKLLTTTQLEERMGQYNPELLRVQFEKNAAKADQSRARQESSPDYSIGLQYINTGGARSSNVAGDGDDPLIATFSIGLPVRRARLDAANKEARARTRMVNAKSEAMLDRLRSELAQAHYRARDANRQIQLYQSSLVPRAEQSFDAIETDFRSGQSDFNELIDANRVLLNFRLSLQRAQTDQAIAHARLEYLVGATVGQNDSSSTEQPISGSQQ